MIHGYANGNLAKKVVAVLACLFYTALALPRPSNKAIHSLQKRSFVLDEPVTEIECVQMASDPGEFWFSSPGDSAQVCGLYMIAPPDHVVELHFLHFDVSCDKGSLVEWLDGWELRGEFFPGELDHDLPLDDRYKDFCGKRRPMKPLIASQNVALLQFRVARKAQGFRVKVVHRRNPTPCNVIATDPEGVLTLSNHGRRINCSASILYPEMVTMETVNVGGSWSLQGVSVDTGLLYKCEKRGLEDYVELRAGTGMDPLYMSRMADFCGVKTNIRPRGVALTCGNSVVRLVSSGHYHNSLTFRFRQLVPEELDQLPPQTC